MTRRCTVCELATLAAVDRELVTGGGNISALAKRHGVSRNALLRHQTAHLPKALVEARAEAAPDRVALLMVELERLRTTADRLIDAAEARHDIRGATGAVREARGLLELLAKMEGTLQPAPTVQINLHEAPEFQSVAARVLAALEPYQAAKQAVAIALRPLH
jgi:transposase-like protein